jgi:hypothetical protein
MKNIEENFVVPLTRPAGAGHPLPSGEGLLRLLLLTSPVRSEGERSQQQPQSRL